MMSEEARRAKFGERTCHWPPCSKTFVPSAATQACCTKTCAMRVRWFEDGRWRDPTKSSIGGRRGAAKRRRHALDRLVTERFDGRITERDIAVFRLAFGLGVQVARERWRARALQGHAMVGRDYGQA